jgi:ankyrin repeat protein
MSNYEKYIKYKKKYLLLKSNNINGGTTPIPFKRVESKYVTNQGNEGTCYAHVATRMLTRIIKMQYSDIFQNEEESCNYYYNTQKCVIDNTIFDCFNYISIKKDQESGCETATFNESGENMSALLFHYIYTFIRDTFGCNGSYGDLTVLYFLIHLKYDDITVESIKKQLNYNPWQIGHTKYTESQQSYFNNIIKTLNEVLNNYKHILLNNYLTVYNCDPYKIDDITEFINLLKIVLDNNYYAYIGGCSDSGCKSSHAVLISGLIKEGSDTFLIIKNSWGTSSQDIPTMGIINNKININWLINNKHQINNIIFLYPSELIQENNHIFKHNNKYIINEVDFVDIAISINKIDIAKILIKKINVNARNKDGETTLILASKKEYIDLVKYLIKKPDIDINIKDNNGNTALITAASNGNIEIVTALLDIPSIDINAKNNDGDTAVNVANNKGYIEILIYLLKIMKEKQLIDLTNNDNIKNLLINTDDEKPIENITNHDNIKKLLINTDDEKPIENITNHDNIKKLLINTDDEKPIDNITNHYNHKNIKNLFN